MSIETKSQREARIKAEAEIRRKRAAQYEKSMGKQQAPPATAKTKASPAEPTSKPTCPVCEARRKAEASYMRNYRSGKKKGKK